MNIYNCERHYSDEELKTLEAEFVNADMIKQIITETSMGYDENGELLFYFVKNCLSEAKELESIIDDASTFTITTGRGTASGKLDMSNPLWAKALKNITLEDKNIHNKYTLNPAGIGSRKYKMNNPTHSNLIGYYEKKLINYKSSIKQIPKCRLTQFSNRFFIRYKSLIPYFEKISEVMSECCKKQFKRQNEFVAKHRERIGESCFSTITINKNFRTACHIDKGDFKNGIGTITTMGDYSGGEFCLVDYKLGFDLQPNDILFVNVHKLHGNLPFKGTRYSLVSYVRENIVSCGLKYNYNIVIPSYGRSVEINKRTLKLLANHNISPERIYIFIVKEELEAYSYLKELGYNIVLGLKGVSVQRAFISHYFKENETLVWMDDDIENIYTKIDDKTLEPIDNLEQFFIDGFTELEKRNLNCYGIYPIKNPYFMKNKIVDGLQFIAGAFRMTFNKPIYETCIDYSLIEDYARSLNYYINDGSVLRNEGVCIKVNYMTLKGGINLNKKDREAQKLIELNKIKATLSGCDKYLKIVEKKKTSDIRFKKLKRFNPKQEIIASFWEGDITEKEIKCIQSWVKMGYKFQLYSYNELHNELDGVVWINADNIVEKSWMDKFPTICSFSDYFRYKLIFNDNVVWVDCDLFCLNPLPQRKYIISSEHMKRTGAFSSNKYYKANIGCLKIPPRDLMIESIIEYVENNIDKIKENNDCMNIFEKYVEIFNYYEYVSLPMDFCPVSWAYAKELYDGTYESCAIKYEIEKPSIDEIKKNSCAIHLWNNINKKTILPVLMLLDSA